MHDKILKFPLSSKTVKIETIIPAEFQLVCYVLTAVFFETGAMPVPTKLGNPTICGSGDPFHSYLTHP